MQVCDIRLLPRGHDNEYGGLSIEIAGISLRAGLRHQGAILSTHPVCLLVDPRERERLTKPSDRINISK